MALDDPVEGSVVGVPARRASAPLPGRLVVAASGCEAQAVDLAPLLGRIAGGPGGPSPIGALPTHVAGGELAPGRRSPDGALELVAGRAFDTLETAALTVPDGEHVLVAGPARSGRTTTLLRLATSWCQAVPGGLVRIVAPRTSPCWPSELVAPLDVALTDVSGAHRALLVVDDAERVADPGDRLAALLAERPPGLLVVAAGRPDALRALFGHWTAVVRRSRVGILAAACADVDGDLLGELLPRRRPLAPRPGLAWLIDGTGRHLAQVGADDALCHRTSPRGLVR
jgi:S-DNA-T family DNA segregation ATPase FtsK/SpoIIIE